MRRPSILFIFFLSLSAVSCYHQTQAETEYVPVEDTSSIKYEVLSARSDVTWTRPIEPDALSAEPVGKVRAVRFYPAAGVAVMKNGEPVYPTLEDFGSLDISGMKKSVLYGINDFLKQLSSKSLTFSSSFFDKPYEGVVILYEASFLPDIHDWTVGKPSGGGSESFYEVPVRLSTEEGWCNIRIYLNPEKEAAGEVCVQQVMFGAVKKSEQ